MWERWVETQPKMVAARMNATMQLWKVFQDQEPAPTATEADQDTAMGFRSFSLCFLRFLTAASDSSLPTASRPDDGTRRAISQRAQTFLFLQKAPCPSQVCVPAARSSHQKSIVPRDTSGRSPSCIQRSQRILQLLLSASSHLQVALVSTERFLPSYHKMLTLLIFLNSNRNHSKEASLDSQIFLPICALKRGTQARDIFLSIFISFSWTPENKTLWTAGKSSTRATQEVGATSQILQYVDICIYIQRPASELLGNVFSIHKRKNE